MLFFEMSSSEMYAVIFITYLIVMTVLFAWEILIEPDKKEKKELKRLQQYLPIAPKTTVWIDYGDAAVPDAKCVMFGSENIFSFESCKFLHQAKQMIENSGFEVRD